MLASTFCATAPLFASPLPSRRSEVVEVVEKVAPAVVNIAAEQTVRRARSVFDQFFFGLDPRPAKSLGSGVIIDPKGIILTNDHVISGASRIVATTKTGQELACEVIGSDLVKFGHVKPVWVGLHGRTVASREEEGRGKGFRVRSVDPGSPAERAGIRPGDQILAVDSTPIDSQESFETALSTHGPGRPMKIVLKGGSGERTVNLSGQDPPADYGVRILRGLGMSVRPARGGLRISIVDARGAAAHAGLESGDTLLALNGTAVADTDDINKVLSRDQSRTTLVMVVGRGSWEYTLTFPLD